VTDYPEQTPESPPSPENKEEFCNYCGTHFKEGALFCDMCGSVRPSVQAAPPTSHMDWRTWALRPKEYLPMYRPYPWRSAFKAFFAICILSIVLALAVNLITLVYGMGLVTPYILDTSYNYGLFIVLPVFINLLTLSGYPLLGYYFLIVAIIVASCTWVFLVSYPTFVKEMTMKAKSREHSPLFDIGGLLTSTVFLTYVVLFIAILAGASDTGGPSTGDLEDSLFALANAPVWEEVIVRVLLIGLPLLIIHSVRRKRSRPLYSYILGGKFKFGIPEVVLVIASATIFGYAHFLGGWGFWKVPAAAIGGVAFGYLFLRHGLPAAIVMHFAVDYTGMPSQVFNFSNAFEITLILLWIGLGFAFTIYYITRIGEFLTGTKFLEARPEPAGAPWLQPWTVRPSPPRQGSPDYQAWQQNRSRADMPVIPQEAYYGGYVCPNCGYTQARWVDGRFQCLRCGRLT
jgi:hypothetical protein